jgi:magnesium-transporting ATPase (P-type)
MMGADKNSKSKESSDSAPDEPKTPWHAMELQDVYLKLGKDDTLPKIGLTSVDVEERLEKYGENKLSEKHKVTLLERIWKQIGNVLVAVLVFVAAVSAIRAATATDHPTKLTNWLQVALIILVITINTMIGIYQEGSAEEAAAALKSMLSSNAVVIRDGKETEVPAQQLVPGDVVKLSLGDRVPADLRLLSVTQLATAESALTGESLPIEKIASAIMLPDGADPMQIPLGDRRNMCFSATLVSQGTGVGIVVCTGDYTEIGTINKLVNDAEERTTNVLEQIDRVSTYLAVAICICSLITFLVAWLMAEQTALDALSTALVCAVAMIPEGLEAIVTMTYSASVATMAKNNAIIRALPAVETLGSVTVICSDKTGTLTQNIMSTVAFVTAGKRYRNNYNATERTTTNFVEDDSYMASRAANISSRDISRKPFDGYSMTNSIHLSAISDFEGRDDFTPAPAVAPTGDSPTPAELRQAIVGGVLCSKCVLGTDGSREGEIGNPTELSILRASYFGDIDVAQMKEQSPIIAEVPFSSDYKFMATVHEPCLDGPDNMDNLVVHVKGAPDRMVQMCKYQAKEGKVGKVYEENIERDYWTNQIAILSSHGLRVLALCRGSVPKGSITEGQQLDADFVRNKGEWLTLMGLCAIMDPPRPECVSAIQQAHGAGVRVAMITGDHKDTALAIGLELGLVDEAHSEAITGPELDAMDDDELQIVVQKYNVFARASPQNKIRIVKALQANNEICAMTGKCGISRPFVYKRSVRSV